DHLVDLPRIELRARERLRRRRLGEVEHVEVRELGPSFDKRSPRAAEYQHTRHCACMASDQASFDVMSMMQSAGQWEAAYDRGVVVTTRPLDDVRVRADQFADSDARVVVVLSRLFPQGAEAASSASVERIVVTNVKEHLPLPLHALYPLVREHKESHRHHKS